MWRPDVTMALKKVVDSVAEKYDWFQVKNLFDSYLLLTLFQIIELWSKERTSVNNNESRLLKNYQKMHWKQCFHSCFIYLNKTFGLFI